MLVRQSHEMIDRQWCDRRFTHISGHPSAAVKHRTGKVRQPKTDVLVLPLCHATNQIESLCTSVQGNNVILVSTCFLYGSHDVTIWHKSNVHSVEIFWR